MGEFNSLTKNKDKGIMGSLEFIYNFSFRYDERSIFLDTMRGQFFFIQ